MAAQQFEHDSRPEVECVPLGHGLLPLARALPRPIWVRERVTYQGSELAGGSVRRNGVAEQAFDLGEMVGDEWGTTCENVEDAIRYESPVAHRVPMVVEDDARRRV